MFQIIDNGARARPPLYHACSSNKIKKQKYKMPSIKYIFVGDEGQPSTSIPSKSTIDIDPIATSNQPATLQCNGHNINDSGSSNARRCASTSDKVRQKRSSLQKVELRKRKSISIAGSAAAVRASKKSRAVKAPLLPVTCNDEPTSNGLPNKHKSRLPIESRTAESAENKACSDIITHVNNENIESFNKASKSTELPQSPLMNGVKINSGAQIRNKINTQTKKAHTEKNRSTVSVANDKNKSKERNCDFHEKNIESMGKDEKTRSSPTINQKKLNNIKKKMHDKSPDENEVIIVNPDHFMDSETDTEIDGLSGTDKNATTKGKKDQCSTGTKCIEKSKKETPTQPRKKKENTSPSDKQKKKSSTNDKLKRKKTTKITNRKIVLTPCDKQKKSTNSVEKLKKEKTAKLQKEKEDESRKLKQKQKQIHTSEDDSKKEMAAKFLKEKERILSSLPSDLVKDFKQIGFTKWEGQYQCVLQLGPFDVCPGEVRKLWMNMYNERINSDRPISRLVYWYGADIHQAFSLVPKTKITKYENGIKKGWHKVPKNILRKLKRQKRLSVKERSLMKNLKAAQIDFILPREQRSQWLFDFKENHEEKSDEDDDSVTDDDNDTIHNDDVDQSDNEEIKRYSISPSVQKPISSRTVTASDDSSDSDCGGDRERDHISKKKGKKRKHSSTISPSSDAIGNNNTSDLTEISNGTKKRKVCPNDDMMDMRILLQPINDKTKEGGKKQKRYKLQVQKNGTTITAKELQLSDSKGSFEKQLIHQNVTLNFTFKL